MSNSSETNEKPKEVREQFGNRELTADVNVFSQNAWDNVQWDVEMQKEAQEKILKNSTKKFTDVQVSDFEKNASQLWDKFYDTHQDNFFKDRNWLFCEFPELFFVDKIPEKYQNVNQVVHMTPKNILEIGCGVGNTVVPILEENLNPELTIYASDFSQKAVQILKESKETSNSRCVGFTLDATDEVWDVPFPANTLDIIIFVFSLSAIDPVHYRNIIQKCYTYLKPGGLVLFRDYGRYDMTQLRFKPGRCLAENFYVRGDGTRVYYFERDELNDMFVSEGFDVVQSFVDHRLQVNRGKMLKMYRIWVQAKYMKPLC